MGGCFSQKGFGRYQNLPESDSRRSAPSSAGRGAVRRLPLGAARSLGASAEGVYNNNKKKKKKSLIA